MAWLARGLPLASRGVIDLAHARTSPSLMKPSRHSSALLALALAAPALTGCIQTPRPDPALDVPKVFGNAPGDRAAAPPRADWWKSFGSAELTRMVQTAEAENLDIAAAVARIQQADAQAKIAGSALLPVVDLSASTARSRSADLSGRGGTNGSNRFGSSLSASYELDFWGKNQSIRAAADQNALATRFDRDTVALTAPLRRRRPMSRSSPPRTAAVSPTRTCRARPACSPSSASGSRSAPPRRWTWRSRRAWSPTFAPTFRRWSRSSRRKRRRSPSSSAARRSGWPWPGEAWTRSWCRASRPACPRRC